MFFFSSCRCVCLWACFPSEAREWPHELSTRCTYACIVWPRLRVHCKCNIPRVAAAVLWVDGWWGRGVLVGMDRAVQKFISFFASEFGNTIELARLLPCQARQTPPWSFGLHTHTHATTLWGKSGVGAVPVLKVAGWFRTRLGECMKNGFTRSL